MGCRKQGELISLRAAVKRFESGKEIQNLQSALDSSLRKIEKLQKQNDCLTAEINQLRIDNRFLMRDYQDTCEHNKILIDGIRKLEEANTIEDIIHSDQFMERMDNLFFQLMDTIDQNRKELELKDKLIRHMKSILNTDGTNSGTPTSKTPLNKDKVRPNSRKNTGNPRGGVKGHPKTKLPAFSDDEITETVRHPVENNCPQCNGEMIDTGKKITKDETDFEVKLIKRRHVFGIYRCTCCGKEIHVPIPNSLKEDNQYGTGVQSTALSLMNSCNVSINKTGQFIAGITNEEVTPCDGYIAKLQKRSADALEKFIADLKKVLVTRSIVYWDDTVIMIDKQRSCLRFYGDERIAWYVSHKQKNLEGILEDEILQNLSEETYVMHDHNSINYNEKFIFKNLECNIHLIRDCQRVYQNLGHSWANDLHEHISAMIHKRKERIDEGISSFSKEEIREFHSKLDSILMLGRTQNRKDRSKYYGNEEFTLLNRIEKYRSNYFLWVEDFGLPTTDSLSERALRGVKSKMKISGQFFTTDTANYYARIKSYIETCHRNGINEIKALQRLCSGNPYTVKEILNLNQA